VGLDGRLVGNSSTGDEPFDILLQAADVQPPANWTSNWLPAPAGGGSISVNRKFPFLINLGG
jgi:hypothetical protein